ncbi:EF-P beta-lysylation protein EpmB [Dongshaea marina]|uniref:EF-P beta-lysylation protein EpmB n=1 Tax=Dongshaea marina TaxID=2047966 RepID=UPI000D3E0485|nr:EF-P beta-lysylation protein EpmB [Dongshaea marina]
MIELHSNWQKQLAEVVTSPEALLEQLNLTPEECGFSATARQSFALRVPRPYLDKIEKGNPRDPLLLQILPHHQEELITPGYSADPLDEQDAVIPGLLHKYKGRVLLMYKTGCAINCRYCFRRHFPYRENHLNQQRLQEVIGYLEQHQDIHEVILSGGDPLMASDQQLKKLIEALEKIPHLRRLRIHSRLPVTLPSRLDASFARLFEESSLQHVLVFHINHPNELDETFARGCTRLRQAGVTLLNQSVLLKEVNDDVVTLKNLSERLFECGILPYYLHQLDKVQGAAHFEVGDDRARDLMCQLLGELPGFLLPRLVRENGGESSKTPLISS